MQPPTTWNSIMSRSPTTRWSRRAMAASSTASPMSAKCLPAGGNVFAMLDISDVYMDIYLPTEQAGRVRFGAEARIVLDAYPELRDSGQGFVHCHASAIHAQDGGDPERARQADVPRPRAAWIRNGCAGAPNLCAADCRASPMSRPIQPWHGRRRCKGARRNERCDASRSRAWTRSRSAMREPWRSTR